MRFYPKDIIKHTNETKTKNTDQLISHHSQEENSVFYFLLWKWIYMNRNPIVKFNWIIPEGIAQKFSIYKTNFSFNYFVISFFFFLCIGIPNISLLIEYRMINVADISIYIETINLISFILIGMSSNYNIINNAYLIYYRRKASG